MFRSTHGSQPIERHWSNTPPDAIVTNLYQWWILPALTCLQSMKYELSVAMLSFSCLIAYRLLSSFTTKKTLSVTQQRVLWAARWSILSKVPMHIQKPDGLAPCH
jgi:hypothetical protein